MNKKDYPLRLLRDLASLMKELRARAAKHYVIIEVTKDTGYIIEFADKEHEKFVFSVSQPQQAGANRESQFNTAWRPQTEDLPDKLFSTVTPAQHVIEYFDKWIALLRGYDNVQLTPEEQFTKRYQDEIFLSLEIVDEEDAETAPFDHKRLLGLYGYLSYVEEELKREGLENPEVAQIVEETKELKENIQNHTKNANMRFLSRILALAKKHSLPLFFKLAGKLFDKGMDWGLDWLKDNWHLLLPH